MLKATATRVPDNIRYQNKWIFLDDLRCLFILLITCVVCYANTIFNNYSLDDDFAVSHNVYIQQGFAGIPDLLTHPYATSGNKSVDFRPVTGITLAIEQQFFSGNPHVSHFVNLVLFTLCVLLIFTILKKVFGLHRLHPVLPLLISLFYAVHPVHTEVVSSIKNRDEILSFSFILLTLLYSHKFFSFSEDRWLNAVLAFVFTLLSYTSKMTSIPFVATIILTGYYYGFHKQKLRFYLFHLLLILFSIGYFSAIIYFLERPMYDLENPLLHNEDISVRLGTALETLFFYFKFLLVPYPPRFYYGYNVIPLVTLSNSAAMVSLILHTTMLAYAVWLFVKREVLGLIILSYLASIFLYSNLIILYPGIVSERAIFPASLWFIAGGLLFIYRIVDFGKVKNSLNFIQQTVILCGSVVLLVYGWLTIQRNFQWKDTLTLMSSDIKHLDNSTLANYFYASALHEAAEQSTTDTMRNYYVGQAKKYYRETIRISPAYYQPYFKLGMILEYAEQKYDSAYEYFSKAYTLDTTKTTSQFQLAKLEMMKGRYNIADKLFTELYTKMPDDTFTLFFYARTKFFMGDTARGFSINEELIKLDPQSYYGYWNKGLFYFVQGRLDDAAPLYLTAFRYGYRDQQALNDLMNYYSSRGQTEKIEELHRILGR